MSKALFFKIKGGTYINVNLVTTVTRENDGSEYRVLYSFPANFSRPTGQLRIHAEISRHDSAEEADAEVEEFLLRSAGHYYEAVPCSPDA